MNIGSLRRRTRHVDVGGYKYERIDSVESEDLQEPLLGQSSDDFHRSRNVRASLTLKYTCEICCTVFNGVLNVHYAWRVRADI